MHIRRRFFLLFLALCLLAASVVPAAGGLSRLFPPDADAYDALCWAQEAGITAPADCILSTLDSRLTLKQAALWLHRYAYEPVPHSRCADALPAWPEAARWYAPLHWCAEQGLVAVSEAEPNRVLSRTDALLLFRRYVQGWERRGAEAEAAPEEERYVDLPADPEGLAAWRWALTEALLPGTTAYTLSPDKPMTRLDFLCLLYRYSRYPGAPALQCETEYGLAVRGWQRKLLETAELALGAEWVDDAYELGEDGIPTVIDCSGYVNWMFTYSGFRPYEDLVCKTLWNSETFEHVLDRGKYEEGADYLARISDELKPGDLLLDHDPESGWHIMVYLELRDEGLLVLHSVSGLGVTYSLFPPGSGYIKRLHGVLRYTPEP
jgi:hypothetical protein